jgi:hypothetical protein
MNTFSPILQISLLVTSLAVSGASVADSVTIPHAFSSGGTAVAAEVNANFSAVSSAVNDNDTRITTNSANITTNTNNISANTSDIESNTGRITTLENAQGGTTYVSVNARNFSNRDGFPAQKDLCIVSKNPTEEVLFQGVTGAETAGCDLVGAIQLPHNGTISSMKCGMGPIASTATVTLYRERFAGSPIREAITTAAAPALFNGAVTTTATSIAADTGVVDNSVYSYFIFVDISTDNFAPGGAGAGGGFRFGGCSIEIQL